MATSWNGLGRVDSASATSARENHHRGRRADQQEPDPAAVFRGRPPVPQVQHDHAEEGPGGERLVQPGDGRFDRMGSRAGTAG